MKKNVATRTIVYFAIAALLLMIPMCIISFAEKAEDKTQVDILFLGDSLIGQYRDETSVPYLVGEALGKTTFNGAFGGSTMTWYPGKNSDYFSSYGMNFPVLVSSIVESDFRVQKSIEFRTMGSEDFSQVLTELENIDFSQLEMIVLEYGTNDYFSGTAVNGEAGDYGSFEGSFCTGIEQIRDAMPDCRILVVGPTFNWYFATEDTCEDIEFGGGYLLSYVEKLQRLCQEYQIEFLDLYDLYEHYPLIIESWEYTEDGIHPNENGRQMIADAIVNYLNENP